MNEPEYAEMEHQRAHRIASLGVVIVYCAVSWISTGHFAYAFRTGWKCLLPLACIWFPEALAQYRGVLLGRGRHIDEPSHPAFLRWAAWFLLLVPGVWVLMTWLNR